MAKVKKHSKNTKCLGPSQCVMLAVVHAKGKRSHGFWWGFEELSLGMGTEINLEDIKAYP